MPWFRHSCNPRKHEPRNAQKDWNELAQNFMKLCFNSISSRATLTKNISTSIRDLYVPVIKVSSYNGVIEKSAASSAVF